jgi:hypothetical protein
MIWLDMSGQGWTERDGGEHITVFCGSEGVSLLKNLIRTHSLVI